MDGLIGVVSLLGLLVTGGFAIGQLDRPHFSPRWLLVAAAVLLLNDAALTNLYGLLPKVLPAGRWNWQGKILAVAVTSAVVSHPAFGWRRTGMTLAQNKEGRRVTFGMALAVVMLFFGIAVTFPTPIMDRETLAFQLTMPGFDEEPFYRGALLLALNEAFGRRKQVAGIAIGWGGLVSCAMFGLAHAFSYSNGGFLFDPMIMAVTALPALCLIWFRERTGSVLVPVLLHNFANAVFLLV